MDYDNLMAFLIGPLRGKNLYLHDKLSQHLLDGSAQMLVRTLMVPKG